MKIWSVLGQKLFFAELSFSLITVAFNSSRGDVQRGPLRRVYTMCVSSFYGRVLSVYPLILPAGPLMVFVDPCYGYPILLSGFYSTDLAVDQPLGGNDPIGLVFQRGHL